MYTLALYCLFIPLLCLGVSIFVAFKDGTSKLISLTCVVGVFLLGVWVPEVLGIWSQWRLGLEIANYCLVIGAVLTTAVWICSPLLQAKRSFFAIPILMTIGYAAFWANIFVLTHGP